MSRVEVRLSSYKENICDLVDKGEMLLASDVLDMLEQLGDDLMEDKESIIKKFEEMEIKFSSFSDPLIAIKDVLEILKNI